MLRLKQKATLTNLLSTTETHGDEPVDAIELKLKFEGVKAEVLAVLFAGIEPATFVASFWDDEGDARYFANMGRVPIESAEFADCYIIKAFGQSEKVSRLKGWLFLPVGGNRCLVTVKVRIVEPGQAFAYQALKSQKHDIEVDLVPDKNAAPETKTQADIDD